jgi:hypothetical protein
MQVAVGVFSRGLTTTVTFANTLAVLEVLAQEIDSADAAPIGSKRRLSQLVMLGHAMQVECSGDAHHEGSGTDREAQEARESAVASAAAFSNSSTALDGESFKRALFKPVAEFPTAFAALMAELFPQPGQEVNALLTLGYVAKFGPEWWKHGITRLLSALVTAYKHPIPPHVTKRLSETILCKTYSNDKTLTSNAEPLIDALFKNVPSGATYFDMIHPPREFPQERLTRAEGTLPPPVFFANMSDKV